MAKQRLLKFIGRYPKKSESFKMYDSTNEFHHSGFEEKCREETIYDEGQ